MPVGQGKSNNLNTRDLISLGMQMMQFQQQKKEWETAQEEVPLRRRMLEEQIRASEANRQAESNKAKIAEEERARENQTRTGALSQWSDLTEIPLGSSASEGAADYMAGLPAPQIESFLDREFKRRQPTDPRVIETGSGFVGTSFDPKTRQFQTQDLGLVGKPSSEGSEGERTRNKLLGLEVLERSGRTLSPLQVLEKQMLEAELASQRSKQFTIETSVPAPGGQGQITTSDIQSTYTDLFGNRRTEQLGQSKEYKAPTTGAGERTVDKYVATEVWATKKSLLDLRKTRDDYGAIVSEFGVNPLSLYGKGQKGIENALSYLTGNTNPGKFTDKANQFTSGSLQSLFTWIKQITGVQHGFQEMQNYFKVFPNPEMGPQKFESALNETIARADKWHKHLALYSILNGAKSPFTEGIIDDKGGVGMVATDDYKEWFKRNNLEFMSTEQMEKMLVSHLLTKNLPMEEIVKLTLELGF